MDDKKVTIPLMVRPADDIQFVEEDNDTISENEPSTSIKRNSGNITKKTEHIYNEINSREMPVNFLGVPKSTISRSASTESSDGAMPMLVRSSSGRKKQHDYEKISVASVTSKKSAVERITDGSFFRRRHEMFMRSDKGDEEEHILEALRHIVRKCTSIDPLKRPSSGDVFDLLSTFNEKS